MAAIAFVAMLAANFAVSAFRINGTTTGEVSDSYPNLFAPIGITFAIWGLIYVLLAVYTIHQFGVWGDAKSKTTGKLLTRITPLYIVTSVINTAWVFVWQYEIIWLSLLLIISLLVCLIIINILISNEKLSRSERWLIKFPFNVYFGWITVATIANAVIWLVSIGWDGLGLDQQFWTVAILTVGALIGVTTALRINSVSYILVFAWAYFGILLKHISQDNFNSAYPSVVLCCAIFFAIFVFTAIFIDGKLLKQRL